MSTAIEKVPALGPGTSSRDISTVRRLPMPTLHVGLLGCSYRSLSDVSSGILSNHNAVSTDIFRPVNMVVKNCVKS